MVVALAVVVFAWGHGVLWVSGIVPVGTLDVNVVTLLAYGPYILATLLIGRHVARRSLETFWPATGWPDEDRSRWAYQFDNTRFGLESGAVLVGLSGGIAALIAAPSSIGGTGQDRLAYFIAFVPIFVLGYSISAVGIVTSTRWLVLVSRIHRDATAIDPFDRAPIYAFSRLTVAVGLIYVIGVYYSLSVNGSYQAGNLPSLAFLGVTILAGVTAFVAPLWGIHVRITREKDKLLRDVEQRINQVARRLYELVDTGALDSTKTVNDLLSGLNALRDRILRLPTWPWPPNLFRGFVTALLLPIVVFILTRVISTLVT
jgi:hypothetical protein